MEMYVCKYRTKYTIIWRENLVELDFYKRRRMERV